MSRLFTLPSVRRTPVLCLIAAAVGVEGGGVIVSEAHAQVVPVSRLGTVTTHSESSGGGGGDTTDTFTAWESGSVSNGRQIITVSPGSITANCLGSGYSIQSGHGADFSFSLSHTTSSVALTFDILSPATFTLSGTADWYAATGSVTLSQEGGATLYTYAIPGGQIFGDSTLNASGSLAPGRYVLSVISTGAAYGGGVNGSTSQVNLSATLNVVPAPGGALALAAGSVVLTRRRRAG